MQLSFPIIVMEKKRDLSPRRERAEGPSPKSLVSAGQSAESTQNPPRSPHPVIVKRKMVSTFQHRTPAEAKAIPQKPLLPKMRDSLSPLSHHTHSSHGSCASHAPQFLPGSLLMVSPTPKSHIVTWSELQPMVVSPAVPVLSNLQSYGVLKVSLKVLSGTAIDIPPLLGKVDLSK